jgi:hypothetical protein
MFLRTNYLFILQVVDELELLTVRASPIANGNHHVSGSTSKGGSYFLFFIFNIISRGLDGVQYYMLS